MACLEITCGTCRKTSFANERKCEHCGEADPEKLHVSFDEAIDEREYEREDDDE